MFRKKQIDELRAQVDALRSEFSSAEERRQLQTDRLDTVEVMIDGHDSTLDDTGEILRSLPPVEHIARTEQLAALGDDVAAQTVTIAAQAEMIAQQRALIERLTAQLGQLEQFTSSETSRIQARLAEISESMMRQLDELGHEVDAAVRRAEQAADDAQRPAAALDDVKAAQVRLASEQVRYDLALRAELAELAERLRRSGRS